VSTAVGHDPLRAVWDALEAAGCDPKGDPWKFTALCPGHDDSDPSLSVTEGADQRVLLHCFAGCDTGRKVLPALGLTWADLFPDGHRRAGRRRHLPKPAVTSGDPVVEVLAALNAVGIGYHRTLSPVMFVADRCPGCDERRPAALWIANEDGRALLTCWNGCTFAAILAMLEHELTTFERQAAA
jgi:hypothetical protein